MLRRCFMRTRTRSFSFPLTIKSKNSLSAFTGKFRNNSYCFSIEITQEISMFLRLGLCFKNFLLSSKSNCQKMYKKLNKFILIFFQAYSATVVVVVAKPRMRLIVIRLYESHN